MVRSRECSSNVEPGGCTRRFRAVLPLQPVADLLGESAPGKMTYLVQGVHEDLLLGAGLGYDLSRRPR
jgi:hypothetical protein